ncbi:CBS domain-containing protein [Flammeovirga yaeyamensis]|uniref:CBS domain-containing protein n=1 Tax=Flammeovirga yaeyamensis TaxID=367791 RepID=A0AAX1N5K4_9BACT|nr:MULTISPECIES: CBS domain-containing protein [Flammeovirga]ANQ49714.1 CBS domain-containing protein [Flammeovirga sp. MY04]MBB3697421.1 CBS domain-containing protein [Flammeovirga yaeyamensis]NMF36115.1 CBS domain-containing protein [Flammeovirga yaeyamensis]QWG02848.1 CBS domain-containing protein [Flammeovirga yaeyamensis]
MQLAKDLLTTTLPTIHPDTALECVFSYYEENNILSLPVLKKDKYIGMVMEQDFFDLDLSQGVKSVKLPLSNEDVSVLPSTHLYDCLRIVDEFDVEIIPVVDKEDKYHGTIIVKDMMDKVARLHADQIEGSIVVLRIEAIHYSLEDLSRWVETNNVKILSSFVEVDNNDSKMVIVTLKLNTMKVDAVLATFERFSLNVIYSSASAEGKDDSKDRLDNLMRYLEL